MADTKFFKLDDIKAAMKGAKIHLAAAPTKDAAEKRVTLVWFPGQKQFEVSYATGSQVFPDTDLDKAWAVFVDKAKE